MAQAPEWDFILNPTTTEGRDIGTVVGDDVTIEFPANIAAPTEGGSTLKTIAWLLERIIARQQADPGPLTPTVVSRSLTGSSQVPLVRYTVTLQLDGENAIPANVVDGVFNEIV